MSLHRSRVYPQEGAEVHGRSYAASYSVWDWKSRSKLNKFSNQNVGGSSISSVHFINEMASSLMLTASSEYNYFCTKYCPALLRSSAVADKVLAEGSIRIWRDYEVPGETSLASTFRAVADTYSVGHSSGVLTAWEQQKGHLLVGGDMKVVRLWDATVERHLRVRLRLSVHLASSIGILADQGVNTGYRYAGRRQSYRHFVRRAGGQRVCRWIWGRRGEAV